MAEARSGRAEMLGVKLGSYRVLSRLGEGGMGVVYVGRHEALGHSVAVKVLQPELSSDGEMVQRFFNEAQAATAIRNLGIVQVFDFGTTPDGQAYFVMELLEGQSLASRLQERRLSCTEACRIGRQIANVLQAAHARGITHRDLKPENLFLVPDAEAMGGERVKVLDFGIAKLAGQVQVAGVKTRTGLVMGTPCYMSPEQCRGAGVIDTRSDIYALGCILFQVSCGRPPFVAEGAGEILGAHQFVEPPHPQSLAPDLPSELAALIVKMLAKHPDARPQTMIAVSQALDGILQTLGTSALAPPVPAAAAPAPVPAIPTPARDTELAPQPAAASTTLGGSAGVSYPRVHARGRRVALGLGVLAAAGVIALIVLATATDTAGSQGSPSASVDDRASRPAADAEEPRESAQTAIVVDAASAAGDPRASAQRSTAVGVVRTAGGRPPPMSDGGVQAECLRYRAARRWADLRGCAERLKAVNHEVAMELEQRAALELETAPKIAAFESALRARNLIKARAELDRIPPAATDRPKLEHDYEAEEKLAIAEVIARLDRSKDECQAYNQVVLEEKASRSPRVMAEATRQVKCSSACDHEELFQQGRDQSSHGQLTAALESYEAAWNCKHNPMYAHEGFVVACKIPSIKKARLFWHWILPGRRERAAGISVCIRNGITEAQLEAP